MDSEREKAKRINLKSREGWVSQHEVLDGGSISPAQGMSTVEPSLVGMGHHWKPSHLLRGGLLARPSRPPPPHSASQVCRLTNFSLPPILSLALAAGSLSDRQEWGLVRGGKILQLPG